MRYWSPLNNNGSQPNLERWGDYSSMRIDPIDNCTFWYTTEYYMVSRQFRLEHPNRFRIVPELPLKTWAKSSRRAKKPFRVVVAIATKLARIACG